MSFRSIAFDIRDSIGSLSRRGFDLRLLGKSHCAVHELCDQPVFIQSSFWANLPPELLFDIIHRLEEGESTWPARKHVVACAAVCRSWRLMCKEVVQAPEFCGKLTFPVSLKQPGFRDGTIQCFIKRDRSNLTYHLFVSLNPAQLAENGKFLLSAKRTRRPTYSEYVISIDANGLSRSSSSYIGKLRSNIFGSKFIVYEASHTKSQSGNYMIAQIAYKLNVVGKKGPRKMQCTMHSIPGDAKTKTEPHSRNLENSFRTISVSKSIDSSSESDISSSRFSDYEPLVLKNKEPRWHEQLQCWCLNFKGRVTVASVKNFQLVAVLPGVETNNSFDKNGIVLQFGKVEKDTFTMDYQYPLSAFQAFSICLSSFDMKLACD